MAKYGPFGLNKGFRSVARIDDMPGAGQVVVEGNYAYLSHMRPPEGTTILDISDRRNPRVVCRLEVPPNIHSHKVRVDGDLMLVNYEKFRFYEGPETPGAASRYSTSRTGRTPAKLHSWKPVNGATTASPSMGAIATARRRPRVTWATFWASWI